MVQDDNVYQMSLHSLAEQCATETQRFLKQQLHDTRYCFELFRRSLAENDQQAWEIIYAQYQVMVGRWVKRQLRFAYIDEDIEECVNSAFASVFNSIAKKRKFANFSTLERILRYLEKCACSAAEAKNRENDKPVWNLPPEINLDMNELVQSKPNPEEMLLKAEKNQTIQNLVEGTLKGEQERIVLELYFEQDQMPREIYAMHRDLFRDVQEVHRVKQILLERLSRVFKRDWKDE